MGLRKYIIIFLLCFVATLLAYQNVIKGAFFFDDPQFITNNKHVTEFDVKKIYSSSVTEGAMMHDNFYRPNQQFYFAVLYKVFGNNPIPFHISALFFHALNGFLIILLLIRLKFKNSAAYFIAAIYLLHPIHTEAVCYISGMADPIGFSFLLLALYFYTLHITEQKKYFVYFFVALLLSLFTKESMVILAPLLLLFKFYFSKTNTLHKKPFWDAYLLSGIGTVLVYISLKLTVFNFTNQHGLTAESNAYTQNIYIRLLTFLYNIWEYLKLIFYPIELYYEKAYRIKFDDIWRFAIGGSLLSAWFASFYYIRKIPNLFFGLSWFFIALIPFMGIVPLNALYLEHWLYVPLLGFIIAMWSISEFILKEKGLKIIQIAGIVLIVFPSVMKISARSKQWASPEEFYLNEIKYNFTSRPTNNLGMFYDHKGEIDKARYYYKKTIEINPNHPNPYHNLALLYEQQKDTNNALIYYFKALEKSPNFYYSLVSLVPIAKATNHDSAAKMALHLIEKTEQSEKLSLINIYRLAVEFKSIVPRPYYELAMIYRQNNETQNALFYFFEALQRNPNHHKSIISIRNMVLKDAEALNKCDEYLEKLNQEVDLTFQDILVLKKILTD